MADSPNTISTLNGMFKVVYADKLQDLIPDFAILQKKIGFAPADKQLGAYFAQPVNLSSEAGFTYNGEAGTVVTLNDAVNGTMKEAQVKGSELILKSQLAYTALSRAATQGQRAFKRASAWKIEDMNNAMRRRLEIAMLYGQVGVGTVSGLTGQVITLTTSSWAGGIWAGAENAVIDVYQADKATVRQAGLVITKVDSDNMKLTVSGTVTGIVATDVIFFKGANAAGTFNEMAGIQKILTASASIFGIDPTVYSLWKGNNYDCGAAALTFTKLQDGLARAVNKGLMEDVLLLVSPVTYAKMNTDQAALRSYDHSYKSSKGENGSESLVFFGTNGKVEVSSHPMVKNGDAFALPLETVQRVGSLDVSFGVPGFEEDFFTLVPSKNAVEVQCMADQAIFIEKPAQCVYFFNIA